MTTVDFITALFCRIDDKMQAVPKHPQAHLYPSEVVTIALLFALKGVGPRAFYRWLVRDYRPLFPRVPERTRLFRLFVTHQDWTDSFLAQPTVLGVADSYGVEAVGLILTGASDDGAQGLARIRRNGGVTLVQEPASAERSTMPEAALAAAGAHRVLTLDEIAPFLRKVCGDG